MPPLFLIMMTLVIAPLTVHGAFEKANEDEGSYGEQGADRMGRNSTAAADHAEKETDTRAAAGTDFGFTDNDSNSQSAPSSAQESDSGQQKSNQSRGSSVTYIPQEPLKMNFSGRTASVSMNGMSSPTMNAFRESTSSAFFETHRAVVSSPSVGQTAEGRKIEQAEQEVSQLPKKADSPNSIALRNSETKAEEGNTFVGRKISFDPDLVEKESAVAHEASAEAAEKAMPADLGSDKEFKRGIRQLKKLVTGLEIGMDDIAADDPERSEKIATLTTAAQLEMKPALQTLLTLAPEKADERSFRVAAIYRAATPEAKENLRTLLASIARDDAARAEGDSLLPSIKLFEVHFILAEVRAEVDQIAPEDPEHSGKAAAAYARAYPEIKEKLQSLLTAIDSGEIPKTKSAALALGSIAIEILETAFKSVHLENPLKTQDDVDDPVMVARQIPFINIPFGQGSIKFRDKEAATAIYIADYTIKNVQSSIQALQAPDSEIGAALHRSQFQKAGRDCFIASDQAANIRTQRNALTKIINEQGSSEALEQSRIELRNLSTSAINFSQECLNVLKKLGDDSPLSDPNEARKQAAIEVLHIANNAIKIGDDLIYRLTSK